MVHLHVIVKLQKMRTELRPRKTCTNFKNRKKNVSFDDCFEGDFLCYCKASGRKRNGVVNHTAATFMHTRVKEVPVVT